MLRVGAITNLCIEALAGDTAVLWTALFILKMCVNIIQNTNKSKYMYITFSVESYFRFMPQVWAHIDLHMYVHLYIRSYETLACATPTFIKGY